MEKSNQAEDEKLSTLRDRTATYFELEGRRPRILITRTPHNDSAHTSKSAASAFANMGFDVDLNLSDLPPDAIARIAVENDVHAIGIPCVASNGESFLTELLTALNGECNQRVLVVAWLPIDAQAFNTILKPGSGEFRMFGPHTDYNDSASQILDALA
jgi:methylmalonyl-CoA mutase